MSISVEDLVAQALVLPAEDRVRLIELESRSPSEVGWLMLAARRRDDVRAGKVAMVPVDDAIARVRARIA